MIKTAIVTGASRGIGKAVAKRLAREGYYVYVTYFTDEQGGRETLAEIEKSGGKASLEKLNVSDEENVKSIMSTIEKAWGHLDVLVNNAERDIAKVIEESTFDEWKMAIDSKLHGAWLSTKYALPLLKKSENENIIFITSNADEGPVPEIISYAVATGATNTLANALATYLPKFGIRVNRIMAGQVRTDNWGEQINDDALWKKFADENPMGRVATVEDVADAVLLMINDPHRFINGNAFFVNGGGHLK